MTRITLDADLRSKLLNLRGPLELCDDSGRVVARVEPVQEINPDDYEPWEPPPLSEEEFERRMQEGPDYTTEEVLEYLKRLEGQ